MIDAKREVGDFTLEDLVDLIGSEPVAFEKFTGEGLGGGNAGRQLVGLRKLALFQQLVLAQQRNQG